MRRLSCLLALLLGACAAQGDGDSLDEPELAGDPNVATDESAEPGAGEQGLTVEAATDSGLIDAEEAAFLTLINDYRRSAGRATLRISIALSRAAQAHSTDMATYNYFSHTGRNGSTLGSRAGAAGYTGWTAIAENIAAGNATASGTFTQWKNSAGHNANMLDSRMRVIGIGRAYGETSTYKWYWTTMFGDKVDAVTSHGAGTILRNGGFESALAGTAGWSSVRTSGNWYSSGGTRVGSGARAGTYQLTLNDPDPGSASVTQIALAAPGVVYSFGLDSRRISGATGQYLYLEFLNSSYARVGVYTQPATTATSYARAAVSAAAPAGTRFVRVFAYGPSASGSRSAYAHDAAVLTAM